MKRMYILLFAIAAAFQAGPLFASEGHNHDEATEQAASVESHKAMKYACPMHADVRSDEPGECPKCGMTLKQAVHEETPGEDSHKGHHHKH